MKNFEYFLSPFFVFQEADILAKLFKYFFAIKLAITLVVALSINIIAFNFANYLDLK